MIGQVSENPEIAPVILVADNDKHGRAFLVAALSGAGYRVLAASDGLEALKIITQCEGAIDLLLADLIMPGMDGRALAERIGQCFPRVKLLLTSGFPAGAARHFGYLADTPFIEKPICLSALRRKVKDLLAGR